MRDRFYTLRFHHRGERSTGGNAFGIPVGNQLVTLRIYGPFGGAIAVALSGGFDTPFGIFFVLLFVAVLAVIAFAIVRVAISGSGKWERWVRLDRFARAFRTRAN